MIPILIGVGILFLLAGMGGRRRAAPPEPEPEPRRRRAAPPEPEAEPEMIERRRVIGFDRAEAERLAPAVAQNLTRSCCRRDAFGAIAWCYGDRNYNIMIADLRAHPEFGVDPDALEREVSTRCRSYNQEMLTDFQTAAGLNPDGLYGPASRGALIFYGVRAPVRSIFGRGTTTYVLPA